MGRLPKGLTGCVDQVLCESLSTAAWDIYIHHDFWGWIDKETGLYSVSVGWDNRDWLCKDVTLEELEAKLLSMNPFYEEVSKLSGVL